jgi:hypothetical protein
MGDLGIRRGDVEFGGNSVCSLPCEGEGWGGVLRSKTKINVCISHGFVCKTPSLPPPSQGEEQNNTSDSRQYNVIP